MCFYFFTLFLKVTLLTNIAILPLIWDLIFKIVFHKLILFVLYSKLKTVKKLRVKLHNATRVQLVTLTRLYIWLMAAAGYPPDTYTVLDENQATSEYLILSCLRYIVGGDADLIEDV